MHWVGKDTLCEGIPIPSNIHCSIYLNQYQDCAAASKDQPPSGEAEAFGSAWRKELWWREMAFWPTTQQLLFPIVPTRKWHHQDGHTDASFKEKRYSLISSTDPAIVPNVFSQQAWLLKGLNVMLPQLVSRDTNPWELLWKGCLPIIPLTTASLLCPSPRNSLSATCNVSQVFPYSPRPLLIDNLQSDASSGVLVALRTIIGWKIHQQVHKGKTSSESFHLGKNNANNAPRQSFFLCQTSKMWHLFCLIEFCFFCPPGATDILCVFEGTWDDI